jgi:antitoxin ChpS
MLAVPPALLDVLGLEADTEVGIGVENGRLIVEPQKRPHYTLQELLSQCDAKARTRRRDREWLNNKPVGRELI